MAGFEISRVGARRSQQQQQTRRKSSRIGVHHANAVVWGPVYRTRLDVAASRSSSAARDRSSRWRTTITRPTRGLAAATASDPPRARTTIDPTRTTERDGGRRSGTETEIARAIGAARAAAVARATATATATATGSRASGVIAAGADRARRHRTRGTDATAAATATAAGATASEWTAGRERAPIATTIIIIIIIVTERTTIAAAAAHTRARPRRARVANPPGSTRSPPRRCKSCSRGKRSRRSG